MCVKPVPGGVCTDAFSSGVRTNAVSSKMCTNAVSDWVSTDPVACCIAAATYTFPGFQCASISKQYVLRIVGLERHAYVIDWLPHELVTSVKWSD